MILTKPEQFIPGENVLVVRRTEYYDDELGMSPACIRKQFVLIQKKDIIGLAEVDKPTEMVLSIARGEEVGSGITDKDFIVRSLVPSSLDELLTGDTVYRNDGLALIVAAHVDMLYFLVDAETRTLPMGYPMTIQALESFGFSLTPPKHE